MSEAPWLQEVDERISRIQRLLHDPDGRGMATWHLALGTELTGLARWWDEDGGSVRDAVLEEAARKLESAPWDHQSVELCCSAIRALKSQPR